MTNRLRVALTALVAALTIAAGLAAAPPTPPPDPADATWWCFPMYPDSAHRTPSQRAFFATLFFSPRNSDAGRWYTNYGEIIGWAGDATGIVYANRTQAENCARH